MRDGLGGRPLTLLLQLTDIDFVEPFDVFYRVVCMLQLFPVVICFGLHSLPCHCLAHLLFAEIGRLVQLFLFLVLVVCIEIH